MPRPSCFADAIVVGAGLSGLVDAILLAETGRRVIVLEQHAIPGGYLQQFSRKRTAFDVGFHYVGQTLPGRPLRRMLEHLRVWDRLEFSPLPDDDAIVVREGDQTFGFPTRFDRFIEKATAMWPHEQAAIEQFAADSETICSGFRWFALTSGVGSESPPRMESEGVSFDSYASTRFNDPWLKKVLGFQSFNLGLYPHEIPWLKYVLAMRANFDATTRFAGGGSTLVDALVARATELGVEFHLGTNVTHLECENREATAVVTESGQRFRASLFVAACHPKVVMRWIDDTDVRPVFKERILQMQDSRGALQVFLRLREPPKSLPSCCTMLYDEVESTREPPFSVVLVVNPSVASTNAVGGPRLEAMTYVDYAPFTSWASLPALRRGKDYEQLKGRLAGRLLAMISAVAPEVPDLITDMYVATPLTDEYYTLNTHGGAFGISHDITQERFRRPQTRSRIANLVFTGHSIHMPGICGVVINAFDTCNVIRGNDELFDAVVAG